MPLATVQQWRIDSTSFNGTVHLDADGLPASPVTPNQRGFVLEAEQARQIIRDLSAAVLALELQRHVEQAVDFLILFKATRRHVEHAGVPRRRQGAICFAVTQKPVGISARA
ncbi:hypothetical protein [Paraburkholderia youngii]|uniref:hypothetical protein n=1 Tax=Paraburkholderia youngii TaxID=2782701 RepID=UPI003D1C1562